MSPDSLFYQQQRLIAKLTKKDLNQVLINPPRLSSKNQAKLNQYIKLLESGYPLDYLLGEIQFLDLKILLNNQVLIPREETEWWVQVLSKHLEQDTAKYKNQILVDIGCGSGIIGLWLHKYFQELWSSDINSSALRLTAKNAKINNINRPKSIEASLLDSKIFGQLKYQQWILVSNLPYLPANDRASAVDYRVSFEPAIALYSGTDGLDLFEELCQQLEFKFSASLPTEIYLELDPRNIQTAQKRLSKLYSQTSIWKDLNGHERVLVGQNSFQKKNV